MEPTFIITSPNSQFTQMVREISEEFHFKPVIVEAVLNEAVDRILEICRDHDVFAVISRGGTANMIKEVMDVPVLVAEANDFDILTSLLDATEVSSEIAYVLSSDYSIDDLSWVVERFKIDMRPYFFKTVDELSESILLARREGRGVVVSGSDKAYSISRHYGLPCILVNTGRRTMEELIRRALLIGEVRDREVRHRQQLSTSLNLVIERVFFLDADDRVSLVNDQGLELLGQIDESKVIGQHLWQYGEGLESIIKARRHKSAQVVTFRGKTMLLHSAPVFAKEKFLGTVISLTSALEVERMEHRVRREAHSSGMVADTGFDDMEGVAAAPSMRACLARARNFAASNGTILITGESGVGKDLLAQSIHNGSNRRHQAFVAINCAALPLTLLESELFGYEEGAFTGAKRGGKPGYFELAHGGTLFLDELGLLPVHVQMQLLRVLQSKQVLRVGGRKMIPVDVRVLAATNADLAASVRDGTFRQDLYYRVNVLHVDIPPLRKRPEDVPLLAARYLPVLNRENGRSISGISPELMAAFQNYDWPGNVRELMNYLMRLVVSSPGPQLRLEDLEASGIDLSHVETVGGPVEIRPGHDYQYNGHVEDGAGYLKLRPGDMESMEGEIIRWHMAKYKGNRAKVCEDLGISRTTLWKKLKDLEEDSGFQNDV